MRYLAFDIETIGKDKDSFDETSLGYFREWAERTAKTDEEVERELDNIQEGLPFSPFLGEIVAIGMLDNVEKGAVYFRADKAKDVKDFEENKVMYRVGSEKEILERFWDVAREYNSFVTFNGRGFDVPYLMIRSAVHKIRPTVNLLANRYLSLQRGAKHYDLADLLTFYGAMFKKPNLHFVSQAFGVESPKGGGMEGKMVPRAFREEKYLEIARYCIQDVYATKRVFDIWDENLNFESTW
ncbi:MAG: ribonuclease H-like domain-containing protein [Candidatus Spechtbacteria bacterium]|nr:ribonuclease H-like domain-containing protein [Candidatus Spechtbacteria bacterium]